LGTRPQNGPAGAHFAQDRDIDQDPPAAGCVPAGQLAIKAPRRPPEAREELTQPASGVAYRQGEAKQEAFGLSPHGGHVANGTRQTLPAYRVRRIGVAQKMATLQEPVAGKDGFVPASWCPKGGVIAQPKTERASGLRRLGGLPYLADQRIFE